MASPPTTIAWGPNGHPVLIHDPSQLAVASQNATVHWDDMVLFVTDGNGDVIDFKPGLDGDITPRDTTWAGLTVYDRDAAGVIISSSNATGTSGLIPSDDTDGTDLGMTPTAGFAFSTSVQGKFVRPDGFKVADVQINGVRTFDPKLGGWTTPDAFEGDIRDPASQQKYMWNRGNAIDYSDPSGFDSLVVVDPHQVGGIGGHMEIVVYNPKDPKHEGWLYSAHPPNGEFSARLIIDKTKIDMTKVGALFHGDDVFHRAATPSQDKAVMAHLDQERARADRGSERFNGITNNCADIVANALAAGGEYHLSDRIGLWPQLDRLLLRIP